MDGYEATVEIDAERDPVWEILLDTAAYPDWDSGVLEVRGAVAPGRKIKLVSEVNPGRAFPLKVTEVTPPSRMVWTGGMPLGLFRGVRTFTLEGLGERRTRFTMREDYSGPMQGLIGRSIPDLGPSFEQFAQGLKARAEGGA